MVYTWPIQSGPYSHHEHAKYRRTPARRKHTRSACGHDTSGYCQLDISPRLAAASVVARLSPVTGDTKAKTTTEGESEAAMYAAEDASATRLVDLATPLNADTKLELVKENDPEALKVVRHSAAHVLATAVLELFPETKLGHGPATDSGFFYDFYREKPFTPDDLAAIEKKMAEVVARDEKFVREYEPREQALEEFRTRRRLHEDPLRDQVHGARVAGQLLSQRQICGFLPRAACALDGAREGGEGNERLPARTGWATRRIRNCSAFMAQRSSRRRIWMRILRGWKKRRSATIACWASSLICSASRNWRARD